MLYPLSVISYVYYNCTLHYLAMVIQSLSRLSTWSWLELNLLFFHSPLRFCISSFLQLRILVAGKIEEWAGFELWTSRLLWEIALSIRPRWSPSKNSLMCLHTLKNSGRYPQMDANIKTRPGDNPITLITP